MANIKVTSPVPVYDGQPLTFRSPTDCASIGGLIVHYHDGKVATSKTFQFADAHGNNVGGNDLFAQGVLVKVILDTELNRAYVQNADTNAYLENELDGAYALIRSHKADKDNPHKVTAAQVGAVPTTRTVNGKALSSNISLTANDTGSVSKSGDTMTGTLYHKPDGTTAKGAFYKNASDRMDAGTYVRDYNEDLTSSIALSVIAKEQAIKALLLPEGATSETVVTMLHTGNLDNPTGAVGAPPYAIARVATGTYTGTGTYGTDNANDITFTFTPKLVIIVGDNCENDPGELILVRDSEYGYAKEMSVEYARTNYVTWGDDFVSWYSTYANYQMNSSMTTYHYIAIG